MPEYLSPGVFIEEVPSGLKAIEGVSTSTAAFVGPAARGTVPGYKWPGSGQSDLPFKPTNGYVLTADPSPVLVTSFAEFQRNFGPPLPLPLPSEPDYGYLGHAVRMFFDNGGKRAYIARIVDPAATAGVLRVAQGVVYRLVRSALAGDATVYFTSTRGLSLTDKLSFIRHADGGNPLSTAQPAVVTGSTLVEPFAIPDGSQITITPAVPGAAVPVKIEGKPAVATSGPTPFNLVGGDTLQIQVGPPSEPVQTITFNVAAVDPITPITTGTPPEVEAVISRYASGVRCYVSGGNVVIESDVRGTAASLKIVGGTAMLKLNFTVTQAAGSNVPDANHVYIADLQAIPAVAASPDIVVGNDGAQHLRISSTALGTTATLALTETQAGALALFGLSSPAAPITGSGTAAAPLAIKSYDLQNNSVTFTAGLALDINAAEVYAVVVGGVPTPKPDVGPKFFARTPGSWSANISVLLANSDRAPTQIVSVNAALGKITVQSVSSFYVGAVVEIDHNGASRSIHQVTEVNAPLRQITVSLPVPPPTIASGWVRTLEIDIAINDNSGILPTETYKGLSWNQDSTYADLQRHYAWQINMRSRLVWVQPPGVGLPVLSGSEGSSLNTQPCTIDGFPVQLAVGDDGAAPNVAAYLGQDNGPGQRSGIESLKDITDVRLIAAPGQTSQAVQQALIAQCELLRYRFAILDGDQDPQAGSITSILTHRRLYDSSFAAYYQPWVTVSINGQNRFLPPSGFMAGLYARVDNARGVWKAPANESVFDALGLKTLFTTGEQDVLNPHGVNLIRRFDIGGIRVWGARTLSSDPDVKYINVRRTLIFLEASIDQGTQWVVFEPNTPETWSRLATSVSSFLHTQWRDGALFGRSPEQAFFVRCDETTMTADDILNGRLICQIGVAIVRPAEFVIFQIQQITNFGQQ